MLAGNSGSILEDCPKYQYTTMSNTTTTNSATETGTLHYFYDALCGWCFGMSPHIKELAEEWAGKVTVVPISGGMVTGARIGPATDMASYIRGAYKRVEEMAGVTFGKPFLDGTLSDANATFSSIKPGQALTAVKQLYPDLALTFAREIQAAIYVKGLYPDEWDTYAKVAEDLNLDAAAILALAKTDEVGLATVQEFQRAQDWGITGFPSLVLQVGDQYYMVARGFAPAEEVGKRITRVFAEVNSKVTSN